MPSLGSFSISFGEAPPTLPGHSGEANPAPNSRNGQQNLLAPHTSANGSSFTEHQCQPDRTLLGLQAVHPETGTHFLLECSPKGWKPRTNEVLNRWDRTQRALQQPLDPAVGFQQQAFQVTFHNKDEEIGPVGTQSSSGEREGREVNGPAQGLSHSVGMQPHVGWG